MIIDTAAHLTSGLVLFIARLIQLHQLHTILLVYDDSSQNLLDQFPRCITSYSDVAWIIVNHQENLSMWKKTPILADQNLMVISALQTSAYNKSELFSNKVINRRSKNIILLNENDPTKSKQIDNLLKLIIAKQINAIFLNNLIDRVDIYAWNPPEYKNGSNMLILINEFEFFSSSQVIFKNSFYSGLFFNNVQSMNGKITEVVTLNDPTNVYNVIGPDLKEDISGIEINIIDVIGTCIRSKLRYFTIKQKFYLPDIGATFFSEYVEKSYSTKAPVEPLHDLQIANTSDVLS